MSIMAGSGAVGIAYRNTELCEIDYERLIFSASHCALI